MIGGASSEDAANPPSAILFDLSLRTGIQGGTSGQAVAPRPDKRRTPEQIQSDLQAKCAEDMEKLRLRYADKISAAAARVKPVGERRKESLVKMDNLRAIVRRTNPLLNETEIDELILVAVTSRYGDLADSVMHIQPPPSKP